MMKIVKVLLL